MKASRVSGRSFRTGSRWLAGLALFLMTLATAGPLAAGDDDPSTTDARPAAGPPANRQARVGKADAAETRAEIERMRRDVAGMKADREALRREREALRHDTDGPRVPTRPSGPAQP